MGIVWIGRWLVDSHSVDCRWSRRGVLCPPYPFPAELNPFVHAAIISSHHFTSSRYLFPTSIPILMVVLVVVVVGESCGGWRPYSKSLALSKAL